MKDIAINFFQSGMLLFCMMLAVAHIDKASSKGEGGERMPEWAIILVMFFGFGGIFVAAIAGFFWIWLP
jgi:hypothetical protein